MAGTRKTSGYAPGSKTEAVAAHRTSRLSQASPMTSKCKFNNGFGSTTWPKMSGADSITTRSPRPPRNRA
ncbi:hypothetical protein BH24CHL4_BH24CHL4_26600 [soil metagenome]